jgi:hypothetical protein
MDVDILLFASFVLTFVRSFVHSFVAFFYSAIHSLFFHQREPLALSFIAQVAFHKLVFFHQREPLVSFLVGIAASFRCSSLVNSRNRVRCYCCVSSLFICYFYRQAINQIITIPKTASYGTLFYSRVSFAARSRFRLAFPSTCMLILAQFIRLSVVHSLFFCFYSIAVFSSLLASLLHSFHQRER